MKTIKWVLCLHLSQWIQHCSCWHFCPHTLTGLVPLYFLFILPEFCNQFHLFCYFNIHWKHSASSKFGASGVCLTPSAGSAMELNISLEILRSFLSSAVLSALHQRASRISLCRLPHFVGPECFASVPDPPGAAKWNVLSAHQTD